MQSSIVSLEVGTYPFEYNQQRDPRHQKSCAGRLTEYIEFLPNMYRKQYHSTIFLKQGGETDFHSLRINRFATTILNMWACCSAKGRVRQKLEQPSITKRQPGINDLLQIYIYRCLNEKCCPKNKEPYLLLSSVHITSTFF